MARVYSYILVAIMLFTNSIITCAQNASAAKPEIQAIHQLQTQRQNAIIIILALSIIIVVLVLRVYILKQKKERDIQDLNLQHAHELLAIYVARVRENNFLVEQLKVEIAQLHPDIQDDNVMEEKAEVLANLQKVTILSEEEWEKFTALFEKVYKDFFSLLKKQFPKVTQAEMRLIALNKLNLSAKEIANSLGIAPESVRQDTWQLKKRYAYQRIAILRSS